MRTVWRILIAAAALVAVAVLGFVAWNVFGPGPTGFAGRVRVALADYKQADPTGPPAKLKDASLIERGRYLIRAADCEACHTAIGGQPFAGGRDSCCPSARSIRPTSPPTRRPASASTAMRSFWRPCAAGSGATARASTRRCRSPVYTYLTDADALAIKAYLFSLAADQRRPPFPTPSPSRSTSAG